MIMPLIRTVTGDIHPAELGYCQCHEHLFIADGTSRTLTPALWMDESAKTEAELQRYRDVGGASLVDAQPVGCGRMATELLRASMATGVKIIASTGFHKLDFYPKGHFVFESERERLIELFTGELLRGMYTDHPNGEHSFQCRGVACAGIIKTASNGHSLAGTDDEALLYRTLFSAAAAAARDTGAPLMVHLEMGRCAEEVSSFLLECGLHPKQLILCHMDRVADAKQIAACIRALALGVYLELDTIGRFRYHDDESEGALLEALCEAGYDEQLLLGLDTTRERLKSYGGAIGLDYIPTVFHNTMAQHGLGPHAFRRFLVENPAHALTWKPQ